MSLDSMHPLSWAEMAVQPSAMRIFLRSGGSTQPRGMHHVFQVRCVVQVPRVAHGPYLRYAPTLTFAQLGIAQACGQVLAVYVIGRWVVVKLLPVIAAPAAHVIVCEPHLQHAARENRAVE